MKLTYTFSANIWRYSGKDPWYFITVPPDYAEEIRSLTRGLPNKGYGTVKVEALVDELRWSTSIFPDKTRGSYLMPIKKEIRLKLGVTDGDQIEVDITLTTIL